MNEAVETLPTNKPLLVLLANDIELEMGLQRFADSAGMHLVRSDTAIDLIVMTAVAQVVNIDFCKPDEWEALRDFLADCAEGEMPDNTPLILVNYRDEQEKLVAELAKSAGTIHRCEHSSANAIAEIITSCTAGR